MVYVIRNKYCFNYSILFVFQNPLLFAFNRTFSCRKCAVKQFFERNRAKPSVRPHSYRHPVDFTCVTLVMRWAGNEPFLVHRRRPTYPLPSAVRSGEDAVELSPSLDVDDLPSECPHPMVTAWPNVDRPGEQTTPRQRRDNDNRRQDARCPRENDSPPSDFAVRQRRCAFIYNRSIACLLYTGTYTPSADTPPYVFMYPDFLTRCVWTSIFSIRTRTGRYAGLRDFVDDTRCSTKVDRNMFVSGSRRRRYAKYWVFDGGLESNDTLTGW